MYKKILVPLDGSELAEDVLPHVEFIAKSCSAPNVVLVRAVEPNSDTWLNENEKKQADERAQKDAREYLDKISNKFKPSGVSVQKELITGKAAESIAQYAIKNEVDLIVVATHGRSGATPWVWGSVADRLLRSACAPVLMVRPPSCIPGVMSWIQPVGV